MRIRNWKEVANDEYEKRPSLDSKDVKKLPLRFRGRGSRRYAMGEILSDAELDLRRNAPLP